MLLGKGKGNLYPAGMFVHQIYTPGFNAPPVRVGNNVSARGGQHVLLRMPSSYLYQYV